MFSEEIIEPVAVSRLLLLKRETKLKCFFVDYKWLNAETS